MNTENQIISEILRWKFSTVKKVLFRERRKLTLLFISEGKDPILGKITDNTVKRSTPLTV